MKNASGEKEKKLLADMDTVSDQHHHFPYSYTFTPSRQHVQVLPSLHYP